MQGGGDILTARGETRIAVSKATLKALKSYLRGGEPYDVLIRRLLISGVPRPIERLTDDERIWVLNIGDV